MTRVRRVLLLVALAVSASATATLPTPAQSVEVEEEFDCSRWRVYKFYKDDTVDCGCRCGFTDQFCCS